MELNFIQKVKEHLIRHEGLRLKPYICTAVKLIIGVGRNLDDRGISQKEAIVPLESDNFRVNLNFYFWSICLLSIVELMIHVSLC